MSIDTTVGERFKDAREIYNKNGRQTMEQVKAATEVPKSTISAIERDTGRIPRCDTLSKLACHYGVSTDWLLGLSESRSLDISERAICDYIGLSDGAMEVIRTLARTELSRALECLLGTGHFLLSVRTLASALVMAEKCKKKDARLEFAEVIDRAVLEKQIAKEHPEYEGKFAVYIGSEYVYKLIDDAVSDYRDAARAIVKKIMED